MDELLNFFSRFFPKKKSKEINKITTKNSKSNFNLGNNLLLHDDSPKEKNVFPSLPVNLEYIKNKLNCSINNDVCIKEFNLYAQNKEFKAFLVYIDGLIDYKMLYDFTIKPLIIKNNTAENFTYGKENSVRIVNSGVASNISVRRRKKFNLENYIYDILTPQNSLTALSEFNKILHKICSR